jgi:putative tricarboxylic transport membrane protein
VQNKPGGSGAIAFNYVKGKKGDGHVVLTMATGSFLSAMGRPDLGLGLEHYTPVAGYAFDPQVIAVGMDSKFKTMKDLVEAGKKEPNQIAASITSATGTARVFLYVLERETGAKFKYVSFKSGSEATTAVVGGHVPFTPENLNEMLGHLEGKKMRALAVTGNKRLAALPHRYRTRLRDARRRAERSVRSHGACVQDRLRQRRLQGIREAQQLRGYVHERRAVG